MNKRKLIGYYDYTVILTYMGMAFAFYGILMSIENCYFEAIICLMAAGLCDMLDGTVASTKVRTASEKRFGIQIDSLCDLISFGVMPGMFVYMISDRRPIIGVLVTMYVLAGLIRLAYFNVLEEQRQDLNPCKEKTFMGFPITTIALMLPLVYLIHTVFGLSSPIIYWIALALCGTGFLTPIEIKNPNLIGKSILAIIGILEALGVFVMGHGII